MYLSELLTESGLSDYAEVLCEKPFRFFATITDTIREDKCIFIKDQKWLKNGLDSVSMVITTPEIGKTLGNDSVGLCITNNPRGLFFASLDYYEKSKSVEKKQTVIGKKCRISKTARISTYNVFIGDHVQIDDYAVIEPNVSIGKDSIIQAGTKIGVQGYAVYQFQNKTRQSCCTGHVEIGEGVLIGSNSVVEQALYGYGETVIKRGSFLSSNVTVQHNTIIGERVEVCAGARIAGNVFVGDDVVIYTGVNVANRVVIGEKAIVGIGSTVLKNVAPYTTVVGNPARPLEK